MADKYYTNLKSASGAFNDMIKRFGVVTVMNVKVYDALGLDEYKKLSAYKVIEEAAKKTEICSLDTLKIANITVDGPTKTVTGGQYSNPLIKFGKSARLEMQDALGNANAIDALCGGVTERSLTSTGDIVGLHVGEDFRGPKMLIGDTFFIEQQTGDQVNVKLVIYQFLPDSIFNLTQDAEGDATVFDMNGDLLTTEIVVGDEAGADITHGVFYSIVDPAEKDARPGE